MTVLVRRDMTRPRLAKADEVRNGAQTAVEQPARGVGPKEWRQRRGVGFLAWRTVRMGGKERAGGLEWAMGWVFSRCLSVTAVEE